MTPELLEYELRRLPDVVAVSLDGSAVNLLVNPAADADALRVVVAGMLAAAGVELAVNVMGGAGAAAGTPVRMAPIAAGATVGIGIVAAAVAAAALTGALHLGAPPVHHNEAATARPPAASTPLASVPNFGPATTLLPGAPLLGGTTAGSTTEAGASGGATGAASSTTTGTGSATNPFQAPSPSGSPPVARPGGGNGGTNGGNGGVPEGNGTGGGPETSPPENDYIVAAPAVAAPADWSARSQAAADHEPGTWAPVIVVPENVQ